MVKSGPQS